MGYKLNLACGHYHIDGYINLDKETGWDFIDGLDYPDDSVEVITISHGLMYLPDKYFALFIKECFRVLEPNGVLRITEDDTENPKSERYGGYPGAIAKTSYKIIQKYLLEAGFKTFSVKSHETNYKDNTPIQARHGLPPKVFFIEGIK